MLKTEGSYMRNKTFYNIFKSTALKDLLQMFYFTCNHRRKGSFLFDRRLTDSFGLTRAPHYRHVQHTINAGDAGHVSAVCFSESACIVVQLA